MVGVRRYLVAQEQHEHLPPCAAQYPTALRSSTYQEGFRQPDDLIAQPGQLATWPMLSTTGRRTLEPMKANMTARTSNNPPITRRGSGLAALLAACGFVTFYLVTDLATSTFAATSLPLPNDPVGQARDWFAGNQLAAVLMGASQAVSVLFLAGFAIALGVSRARTWGLVAAALMIVSSICAWTLAAVAPTASLDTIDLLRTANFIAGGTAHVVALGVFVFVASRAGVFGRALRLLAVIALVISVLSLSSLLIFQGAAFILVGRLLCMVWAVSAGVSVLRLRRRRTP